MRCNEKKGSSLHASGRIAGYIPGKRTSIPNLQHPVYQYLLKEKKISLPNQVWVTDITDVKLKGSHVFLVAIQMRRQNYTIRFSGPITNFEQTVILVGDRSMTITKKILDEILKDNTKSLMISPSLRGYSSSWRRPLSNGRRSRWSAILWSTSRTKIGSRWLPISRAFICLHQKKRPRSRWML